MTERVRLDRNKTSTLSTRKLYWQLVWNERYTWWELHNGKSKTGHFLEKEDALYKLAQLEEGSMHE